MTTIPAVYENGVFRPTGPVPLAEGTSVQLTAVPTPPTAPPAATDPDSPGQRSNRAMLAILAKHAGRRSTEPSDEHVARDHDKYLYGRPQ